MEQKVVREVERESDEKIERVEIKYNKKVEREISKRK